MKHQKTIEEYLLETLKEGSCSIEALIASVYEKRKGTSRQGVYRTLRAMKAKEIITIHTKMVSLSAVWIGKMQNYFALAAHYYSKPASDSSFLSLKEGERVSYSFRSILELDIFWSHSLYLFFEVLKNNQPIFAYNPHDWAYFVRQENDAILLEKTSATKRQVFLTVGNNMPIDKQAKRNFDGDQEQYYLLPKDSGFDNNHYLSIIDDYCIEAFLDKNISAEMDLLYEKYSTPNGEFLDALKKLVTKKGKQRLVITRNKKKALRMKHVLDKYFYVKVNV